MLSALENTPDLQQRWANIPHTIRQIYLNDFTRIAQLLEQNTSLEEWLANEQHAKQQSALHIEQNYLQIKEELQTRQKELTQVILEQRLQQKRDEEKQRIAQLQQNEQQAKIQQTQALAQLNQKIQQETLEYAERYHKNIPLSALDNTESNENLRLRLELEAEKFINETVQQLRKQLREVAKEEIDLIVAE